MKLKEYTDLRQKESLYNQAYSIKNDISSLIEELRMLNKSYEELSKAMKIFDNALDEYRKDFYDDLWNLEDEDEN